MICIKNMKSEQCEQLRTPREKMRRVLSQRSMRSPEEEVPGVGTEVMLLSSGHDKISKMVDCASCH